MMHASNPTQPVNEAANNPAIQADIFVALNTSSLLLQLPPTPPFD
jgi:hypothetical protein